jgi:hypothetical protein
MPPATAANGWIKTLKAEHLDVLAKYRHAGKDARDTRTHLPVTL